MNKIEKICVFFLQSSLYFYQKLISPYLGKNCRFTPTCSGYMHKALKIYGLKGLLIGIKRILRCHPWGGKGYDPLEFKKIK